MAGAGLLLGRGDRPDVVGQFCRDSFEHFETRGVDSVVVGDEDAHGGPMSPVRGWNNHLRHPRNNPQLNVTLVGQSLLRLAGLIMSAMGIPADSL
jgi:hypothetical protein